MKILEDTIAAISTPQGSGGLAVIRLSGPHSIVIADQIFKAKTRLTQAESHRAYFGKLIDPDSARYGNQKNSTFLDEVVITVFRAPRSYTREDVVEISCHGGQYHTQRILELLLKRGCRLADPGEFTLRAFLNGRLDLSQAEAVGDMIRAKTELSLRAARSQFQGFFSERIRALRQQLIDVCSLLELELDFAEEDVQFADRTEIQTKLASTILQVEEFLESYRRGKIIREGAKLVIVGKPNVGKSSLLNALLKEERAIVTEIPGTTRDVLEEQLSLGGVLFRVVDTAGVRSTEDRIEREGVNRTIKQLVDADVILFLFDGSQEFNHQDLEVIQQVLQVRSAPDSQNFVAAINKIDLPLLIDKREITERLPNSPLVEISAKDLIGFEQLEAVLLKVAIGKEGVVLDGEPVVTNLRQKNALERALSALKLASENLDRKLSTEFVALDLRNAMDCLGEIIGEVSTEEILGNIFSKFCIGK
jgi:tRNA modification GTPase